MTHCDSLCCAGQPPELAFSNSFAYLIGNKLYSDVQIRTSSKQVIPAHKVILASRSGFFKSLFEMEVGCCAIVEC